MSYGDTMTFERILAQLLEHVPGGVDKREGSVIYDALAPAAAELAKLYIELDVIMDETFVDTASLAGLMKRAKERGVPIKAASFAVVQGEFEPQSLEVEIGSRFNHDSQNYIVTEKIADGSYKLDAENAGTQGNLYSGALLPIGYIDGLQSARIADLLIPGEDEDTAESLRKRYYESLESLSFGGNVADYKEKVNLLDGVGGVKVYPVWNGGGTVRLSIISSTFEPPSDVLLDQVQTAVDPVQNQGEGLGIAPIGHIATVTGVTPVQINVASHITLAAGWEWADAEIIIRKAIDDYFLALAKEWEGSGAGLIVRVSHVENVTLDLPCTLDIADTTLNGQSANLQLAGDEIPVLDGLVNA